MKSFDLAPLLAGKTLGTASDSFVVAEWRDVGGTFDPPRLIAPRHIHHSDDEAWYVLEGKLRVEMGDKEVEAPAGAGSWSREERLILIGIPGHNLCAIC
jgi:mannose-6-phosphate isomerase-like protein (cupin superfamily)